MPKPEPENLAALLEREREALLSAWRRQVRELPSARHLDAPTLNDHVPALLEELNVALRATTDPTIPEVLAGEGSPSRFHGLQRVGDGFDIEEVVAEYNILRGCLHDLADREGRTLQGRPFRVINQVFDLAIGSAVQAFATQRALDVQHRREEYLAFVAHDLRTPLNAISLAARVLERSLPQLGAETEAGRMLQALRRGVLQIESLVGKVLEENVNLTTEIGLRLERRELDLWPLVEALVHDLHPVAGTASTRLTNLVPGDLVVYADASLLRRVLQNLIANAIRYTPRGEVVIGARVTDALGGVECWVRDDGAGISRELVERIFEKGETDPENSAGSGLGLTIVKTFTEAHGGTVTVKSTEGIGSTFVLTFPARPEASAASA